MTGLDSPTPIGPQIQSQPGRWVARANGERIFIPDPEPEAVVLPPRDGVWMASADGSRVFVAAPLSATAAPTESVSSPQARTAGGGVNTLTIPPNWKPFLQRLAFAMVIAHMLTEWAEYSRCGTCKVWSGSSSLVWIILIGLMDISAIAVLLAMYHCCVHVWEHRCKPCCYEVRRRRVGVAETLNAALSVAEQGQGQDQEEFEVAEGVAGTGVINGVISAVANTAVVSHSINDSTATHGVTTRIRTNNDDCNASNDDNSYTVIGEVLSCGSVDAAPRTVDGFVEDVV